jgi:hypothetical protein
VRALTGATIGPSSSVLPFGARANEVAAGLKMAAAAALDGYAILGNGSVVLLPTSDFFDDATGYG